MSDVRLIATDLDGTLLCSDGSVSDRTRAALDHVADVGIRLVLTTGRPPRWMKSIAELTGHHGMAICANGALVYDLEAEQVVRENLLEPEVAIAVAQALREHMPEISFAVEYGFRLAHEPGYRPRLPTPDGTKVASVEEIVTAPVAKLLGRLRGVAPDDLLARATEIAGHLANLTHSSVDGLVEISAAGVSKALALERLADDAGVGSGEVVAFGDMPNDLAMLTWAGHAVAVANAHPRVLEVADEVTLSNDDDGVAIVLERILASGGAPHARP